MINTYEGYLHNSTCSTLKIEEALQIYEEMAASIEKCQVEDKIELWQDCLKKLSGISENERIDC